MGSFTPPPTTALAPGDRLDRYELLCVLAQGGMGTVWLARLSGKLGFERLVALKTILASYTHDRLFCDMFLDEARIAAQIDHENVARILEIGEDRGVLYYAMELIDGHSLRKLYRDVRGAAQAFPMGVALRVVADACAGLHATHEQRAPDGSPLEVVHRDVSPQNLLVSVRGTVKLIDFGVAKARARRSEETAAGTLKGKIEYMAPEQARGEPLDRRADVYSLGAVLYELLAGRPLRDTDDGRQLAALHELMTGAPYAPLPPNVPDVVRGIVDRALARDARARFASAEELRRALEHAMSATGSVATPDDVAGVLAHYSRERSLRRKDAIEQAIRAAEGGRVNAATLVAPLSAPDSLRRAAGAPPAPSSASAVSAAPSSYRAPIQQGMTAAYVPIPSQSSRPGADGPSTGPSMRTAFGAALAAPRPASERSAGKVFLAVCVLVVVGLLGGIAGVLVTKRGQLAGVVALGGPAAATPAASSSASSPSSLSSSPSSSSSSSSSSASASVSPDGGAPSSTLARATPGADPPAPATGSVVVAARDAGAPAGPRPGARTSPPAHRPPGRPAAKPGDGDEYGF